MNQRLAVALVVALAAHALAMSRLSRGPGAAAAQPAPPTDVAIESFEVAAAAAAAPAPLPGASRGEGAAGTRREVGRAVATVPGPSSEVVRAPSTAPSIDDGWSFRPTVLDPSALARASPSSPAAAAEGDHAGHPSIGQLAESLDARDRELGLGRGGPVKSAIEEVVHSAEAPVLGRARYEVLVFADGSVDVDLLDASSEHAGWESLREAIRARVAKKAVRVPPNARGLRVAVAVDASEEYPGGGKPPAKTGMKVEASPGAIVGDKNIVVIVPPHLAVGYQGERCGVGVVIAPGGLSGGAGCAVGALMRVVHLRIEREERF